jgi:hypothetical protein
MFHCLRQFLDKRPNLDLLPFLHPHLPPGQQQPPPRLKEEADRTPGGLNTRITFFDPHFGRAIFRSLLRAEYSVNGD